MKLAIAHIYASVSGSVAAVRLVPDLTVDLDQVVGHVNGEPLSLEQALGPHLMAGVDVLPVPSDADQARPVASPAATHSSERPDRRGGRGRQQTAHVQRPGTPAQEKE